ncbi:hypothetical protein, partial [Streptomyces flavofungini]|uniref:hypothetical protein n=1 Tax=Streptomyces flavofungini TaxID=68200 RepID=UPI0034DFBDFC
MRGIDQGLARAAWRDALAGLERPAPLVTGERAGAGQPGEHQGPGGLRQGVERDARLGGAPGEGGGQLG